MTLNHADGDQVSVYPDLLLARVTHVDESNKKAYFQLLEGGYGTIEGSGLSKYDERLIFVEERTDHIEVVPEEVWEKAQKAAWGKVSWVGVVLLKTDTDTLVSGGTILKPLPTRADVEYKEGFTVEVRENYGVVRVLSDRSIDSFSSLRDKLDEEDFAASIRIEPSKEQYPKYEDFAGYDALKAEVKDFVQDSLQHRVGLSKLGTMPGKGVLFTGDPGTGKTFLARIVANVEGAVFYPIRGPEVVSKYYGQTEKFLRQIFDDAKKQDSAIIFFDELDSIATSRDRLTNDFSRSVVAQLLTLLDGFESDNVFVIAATNRPDAIDPALKRPGRFDKVIEFPLPEETDRVAILLSDTYKNTVPATLPCAEIASRTIGWTPAELTGIWQAAARCAVRNGRGSVALEDYLRGFEQAQSERKQVSRSNRARQPEGERQP